MLAEWTSEILSVSLGYLQIGRKQGNLLIPGSPLG